MDPLVWLGLYLIIGVFCGTLFATGSSWNGGTPSDVGAFFVMVFLWMPIYFAILVWALFAEFLTWVAEKRGIYKTPE